MTTSTALRLEGLDARSLLHRIGTNRLDDLTTGRARATLFCDFRGRLLHRAVVAATSDGALWLLRDDAPGDALAAFLDRNVFRDDVRVADRSRELPLAATSDAAIEEGAVRERDGMPVAARAERDLAIVAGAPASALDERDRIRAGRPAHGREIVEAFTPFEVGLAHEVHLDKGCYPGQEALMRLVTYRSVRRRLVRIGGPGPAPTVPIPLKEGSEPAGILTSAAADGGRWIGLAVVGTEVANAGRPLAIEGGGATDPVEPLPLSRAIGRP